MYTRYNEKVLNLRFPCDAEYSVSTYCTDATAQSTYESTTCNKLPGNCKHHISLTDSTICLQATRSWAASLRQLRPSHKASIHQSNHLLFVFRWLWFYQSHNLELSLHKFCPLLLLHVHVQPTASFFPFASSHQRLLLYSVNKITFDRESVVGPSPKPPTWRTRIYPFVTSVPEPVWLGWPCQGA